MEIAGLKLPTILMGITKMPISNTRRSLARAVTFAVVLGTSILPAFASQPTGDPARDCVALANSVEREPSWYAAECQAYMPAVKLLPMAKAGNAPATIGDPAYQLDLRANPNTFDTFALPNAAAPSSNPTTPLDSYALEHDNASGVLWAIENVTFALGTVDKTTGAFTAGPTVTGLPAGGTITGLAFLNSSSTFFVSCTNGTDTNLYNLNPTTGVATLIGAMGVQSMIDIAINNAGQMYGHSIFTDSIYSINTATGVPTLIGPTGIDTSFAQSIDFDKSTGVLYAWLYVGGGVNQFASIDLATGAATTVSTPTNKEYEGALTPVSLQSFTVD